MRLVVAIACILVGLQAACNTSGGLTSGTPFIPAGGAAPDSAGQDGQDAVGQEAATGTEPAPSDTTPPTTRTEGPPGTDPVPIAPTLVAGLQLPDAVQFGYRQAQSDGTLVSPFDAVSLILSNTGSAATGALTLSLTGDTGWLSLASTSVPAIAAGGQAAVLVSASLASGQHEGIRRAVIHVTDGNSAHDVPVYAAIGDPALATDITFSTTRWGSQAMPPLPRAPWPQTDPSLAYKAYVSIALPDGFRRQAPSVDVLVALHGWNGILSHTLAAKKYVEQAYYSNRNAVLIVPQGLYDQAADDFGQLRQQGGLQHLIDEVLIVLYRQGLVTHPVAGAVAISSHSGAYNSLSDILTKSGVAAGLSEVTLLDSLYGFSSRYEAYAKTQVGKFTSAFQSAASNSPTANSAALLTALQNDGLPVASVARRPLPELVFPAQNLFATVYAAHDDVPTRHYNLGEYWRYAPLQAREPPRPILRRVRHDGTDLHVDVFAEPSASSVKIRLHGSSDGNTFSQLAEVAPSDLLTTITASANGQAGWWLRATAVYADLGESGASDTYFVRAVSGGRKLLVVDAFDRCLDGEMTAPVHDFSARLGADSIGSDSVESCADEAVETGACPLTGFDVVLWNTGLSSTDNPPVDVPAQAALSSYLSAGGRVIANGAELGYALAGTSFLANTLAVSGYTAAANDNAASTAVAGAGALSAIGAFSLGGSESYLVDTPDVFNPASGGSVVLTYGNGKNAGFVHATKHVVSVGFPLETIAPAASRTAVVRALIDALH